jgi:hypothetical protein
LTRIASLDEATRPAVIIVAGQGDKPLRWGFTAAMVILLIAICYWKGDPIGRRWNGSGGN